MKIINDKNQWIIYGLIGLTFFGLFGFFNKLSTFTDAFISNLLIGVTTLVVVLVSALIIKKANFKISKDGFIAGICGSIGTIFLLFALEANNLIVVYPFVAMSGVVFFGILYFNYPHKYSPKQLVAILAGLGVGVTGLAFAAIGASGGLNNFSSTAINVRVIMFCIAVMIFWGLLAYFWFRAKVINKDATFSCFFSTMLAMAATSFIAVLIFKAGSLSTLVFNQQWIYPILSGAFVAIGSYFMLSAFTAVTPKEPIKSLILAIMTNGEIIPVTILALIILKEFSVEGLLGVVASIAGITLLNYVDHIK